jgi:hypothetical protein
MWHRCLVLQKIRNFDPSEIIPLKRALLVTVDNFNGSRWLLLHPHSVQLIHEVFTFCFIHKRIDGLCPFSSFSNCISKRSSTDITLYFYSGSIVSSLKVEIGATTSSCTFAFTCLSPPLCIVGAVLSSLAVSIGNYEKEGQNSLKLS